MVKKRIQRARVTRKKENPIDKFINLGIAICNRYQLRYKGHKSLYYALLSFNKYKDKDLFSYMDECINYDKLVGNKKRITEWEELKEKGLSVYEILQWADKQYKKEIEVIRKEIELEIQK